MAGCCRLTFTVRSGPNVGTERLSFLEREEIIFVWLNKAKELQELLDLPIT
jgi:hypothetical protein